MARFRTLCWFAVWACAGGKDPATDAETDSPVETVDTPVAPGVEPTCIDWCAALFTVCAEQAGLPSQTTCEQLCAAFQLTPGLTSDVGVNTIGCRVRELGAVADATDKALACARGGLSGAGACGGEVENFCEAQAAVCVDSNAILWDPDCVTVASAWPEGNFGDASGDSLACRGGRVGAAATFDAAINCPEAGPASSVCVD